MNDRRGAFEALFAEHHAAVLRYVERRVDDREQARELTMDCFEIAWRRYDRAAPFRRPWLLQTARNLVGDSYRRRDREREGMRTLAAASDRPDTTFQNVDLRLALRHLSAADREILELFYWDGMTAPEIAQIVGCRTSAAWKRLSRARDALRLLLEEPCRPPTSSAPIRSATARQMGGGAMGYVMD
ncbi:MULTISPECIES: RNA polymerase sigma factor [Microbacterium]|uniref:Sigma-70 family RNA polymerase sigma factor n=1 Tax=Microbacterium wangchenii TaxID=2541726 RepID=A0ABX5SSL0_9MICO|nr:MULTISPECIES: sigma-70 family RNA polymerase sigma factor [Microbacterium]MCK6065726.1 sigma-70 family RNA polymerase sigma factor [Microbacterium sp. EYE_512]QBR89131.1 sigma-70 family RNA polymerase sigma factor [Microbacterium wangchenii]TXK08992.1 sigma-70 family RNA polymerase sigma factor [Microbacterium wangchenii]